MGVKILILSHPQDLHAWVISEALKRKGAEPVVWNTSDFPSVLGESVHFAGARAQIRAHGPGFSQADWDFDVVWHRRPVSLPDEGALHWADFPFAVRQCQAFRSGLFEILAPRAFWVNPQRHSSLASDKLYQHQTALQSGLALPETLYTNDPGEISAFLEAHGGEAVFKSLTAATWRDDETQWGSYTHRLTKESLIDHGLLRQTPAIYQEIVPKAHELRVTIMGRQIFTARILSQETATGRLDWRRSYRELKMEPGELPPALAERCFELMDRLSIVFGCFDFIVTPAGDHIFLEVNEMGQFLFIEEYAGLPVVDAFCELLIQGRKDFLWRPTKDTLTFEAVAAPAKQRVAELTKTHVAVPMQGFYEGPGHREP